jgi:2,5-diamino-6-(ribosylamino)-4(3H)-pyrimidinone 5'-phosphate reductase
MSDRPYVICHMIATIDGKILTRRWEHLPQANAIGALYDQTAAEYAVGNWLVGTKTIQEFFKNKMPGKVSEVTVPKGDFIANKRAETFAIALDAKGSVAFDDNEVGGDHLIIITTGRASRSYLGHLRSLGISYLICGRDEIDFHQALKKLRKDFKIKKLLLEGGGLINGAMLKDGLIDEISQLIVPIVDGGGGAISGLFDLRTTPPKKAAFALRLIEQRTLKHGTQWLRYRVKHEKE